MPSWTETIAPDEQQRFDAYAAELRALQKRRRRDGNTPRALHAKAHLGATGTLEVGELPAHLRAGVFARPARWPLYARFSSGSPARQHDGIPDVRGLALKLVGVPGRKIIAGLEEAPTQDFLFIQVPSTSFKDPDEFVAFVRIAARGQALLLPRLVGALGLLRTLSVIKGLVRMPKVRSLATAQLYTAAPIRFGETAARLSLVPEASDPPRGQGKNALRDDLCARLAAGPLSWSLRAQLFVDEATTPIEDASVAWPEGRSPFQELGRVTLPQQDPGSERGRKVEALVESISFDPWHAIPEHRPLGAMMRARAPAYRDSVIERGAAAEPAALID